MRLPKFFQSVAIVSFLFFLPAIAFANAPGIVINQTRVAFDMVDEDEQKFIVEVKNISDDVQDVHIRATDYLIGDDNEITFSNEVDEKNGVRSWVSIKDADIKLASGDTRSIPIIVKTPKNASVGSHRGAILFSFVADDENPINISGQIGVHVLINIKGDVHAGGRVNSFDVPLVAIKPIEYNTEFENLGNSHYVPYGEVVVHNVFTANDEIYKYDKHFVFPDKKYKFSMTQEIPSIFGLYKATVSFVDGEGVVRSKTDYTMGYLFPLIFIIVIITIIILIKFVYKERNNNILKKQKFRLRKSKNTKELDANTVLSKRGKETKD